MEPDDLDVPELMSAEDVASYLALKHANGMSFKQVLDIHTLILLRVGRDCVDSWGFRDDQTVSDETRKMYRLLKDGGYYALNHLEDNDDDWYHYREDGYGE